MAWWDAIQEGPTSYSPVSPARVWTGPYYGPLPFFGGLNPIIIGFRGMGGLVSDIFGAFGITGDIVTTSALAMADPTSANIQAVVDAYAANGQVVPGKLLAYLMEQNESRYPNDLYRATFTPWIVLGIGAALWIGSKLLRGRR